MQRSLVAAALASEPIYAGKMSKQFPIGNFLWELSLLFAVLTIQRLQ